jgi:hypothetical protein
MRRRSVMSRNPSDGAPIVVLTARGADDGCVRRSPSRGPRARRLTAGCAVTLLCVAGCTAVGGTSTSTSTGTGIPGPVLSWSVAPLPTGVEPRTLTAMGDRLLVGGLAAGTPPSPRMLTLDSAGTASEVPLTPHSGYAFEARWRSVASDGTRVIAIGAANGGAHFNNRWTTWSGTTEGIQELPQSFYAFGGWGAGDLVAAVVTSAGEAIVGTWGGAKAGLDGAVWLSSGTLWTRQDPAGTALQSTPALLVGPRSATPDGAGILVAGSAVNLAPGSVAQCAALWRSTTLNSGWRRLDLPQPGKSSEAVSARCGGDHCIIAGQVDGFLAMWDLTGDTATRLAGVPAVAVRDSDPLPDPLLIGGHLVQLTATHGHVLTLTRDGSVWSVSSGPDGTPTTAALVGDHLYVTITHGSGTPATLWQTDARAWH